MIVEPEGAGVVERGRLDAAPPPATGERFTELVAGGRLRIESIVSSDVPDQAVYDQAHDEWAVLLAGSAVVEVDGQEVRLHAGDWLWLPAHTPHRVLATSRGARWLAVHLAPGRAERAKQAR